MEYLDDQKAQSEAWLKLQDDIYKNCEHNLIIFPSLIKRIRRKNGYGDCKAYMILFALNRHSGLIRSLPGRKMVVNKNIRPEFELTAKDISESIGGEYSDYVVVSALKRLEIACFLTFHSFKQQGETLVTIKLNIDYILGIIAEKGDDEDE